MGRVVEASEVMELARLHALVGATGEHAADAIAERTALWDRMVSDGVTVTTVARLSGVSRPAVTQAINRLHKRTR